MFVSTKVALVLWNHREGEEGVRCKGKDPPLQHCLQLEGQVRDLRLSGKAHRAHEGSMG